MNYLIHIWSIFCFITYPLYLHVCFLRPKLQRSVSIFLTNSAYIVLPCITSNEQETKTIISSPKITALKKLNVLQSYNGSLRTKDINFTIHLSISILNSIWHAHCLFKMISRSQKHISTRTHALCALSRSMALLFQLLQKF